MRYPAGQASRLGEPSGVVATGAFLDANQSAQLRELRSAHLRILTSYDWVDRENEIARIPIQRAIDLILEEELPARSPPQ
jgi:hypothetical protein